MTRVFRVFDGDLIEIDNDALGLFYAGDCYLIDAGLTIYSWIGKTSSVEEQFALSYFAKNLKQKRGELPALVRIEEGEEPEDFITLFDKFEVRKGEAEIIQTRTYYWETG